MRSFKGFDVTGAGVVVVVGGRVVVVKVFGILKILSNLSKIVNCACEEVIETMTRKRRKKLSKNGQN
jgi:hypothetical protein